LEDARTPAMHRWYMRKPGLEDEEGQPALSLDRKRPESFTREAESLDSKWLLVGGEGIQTSGSTTNFYLEGDESRRGSWANSSCTESREISFAFGHCLRRHSPTGSRWV